MNLISEDTLRNEIPRAISQQEYQYALQLCALFDNTKTIDDTIIPGKSTVCWPYLNKKPVLVAEIIISPAQMI